MAARGAVGELLLDIGFHAAALRRVEGADVDDLHARTPRCCSPAKSAAESNRPTMMCARTTTVATIVTITVTWSCLPSRSRMPAAKAASLLGRNGRRDRGGR